MARLWFSPDDVAFRRLVEIRSPAARIEFRLGREELVAASGAPADSHLVAVVVLTSTAEVKMEITTEA